MKFILGTKLEMTQVWHDDVAVPVTKVKLEQGTVVQVKTVETDGYDSVVVGYGERRIKNIAKPQQGHTKGLGNFRYLKEFRYMDKADAKEFAALARGFQITTDTFEAGDEVNVVGVSKGRGFQGGVKRHRFHGQDKTHGNKDQLRMPGSIGAGEPQHVFKGTRMAGHMGNQQVTVKNLEVVEIYPEEQYMLVKGALPGARNSVLYVTGKGALKFTERAVELPKKEEVAKEVEEKEVKTEEVKTPEVKVEEKAVEVEVKAEEKQPEAVVAPAKPEVEIHVAKFNELSAEEQAKYSNSTVTGLVSKLEEQYKTDLVPVVMKLAVKELTAETLEAYLINTSKLEAVQAAELAQTIKEQILK